MASDHEEIYERLFKKSLAEGFAGHDPFDGLNSKVFQATPLKHSRLARLAWLQMIKRSPFDLRAALRIEEGVNAKGIALFALAELCRFRSSGYDGHAENCTALIAKLLEHRIAGQTLDGRPTTSFGYNFDWQSRQFFAPRGTPAVVPTAFAAQALVEAYESFQDQQYLNAADEICAWILGELHRVVNTDDEICFSYTPLDRSCVYNASLLAGETLARVGKLTGNEEYLLTAEKAARFVLRRQNAHGSWPYGASENQQWVDNFHTAYVLMSLQTIANEISNLRSETDAVIERGLVYWSEHFFLADGTPKYFENSIYPIDIHACAVAIITFCKFGDLDMARKICDWTTKNMLSRDGYFYYQRRQHGIVKTSFMRWGQAWMAYALATLIEAEAAT